MVEEVVKTVAEHIRIFLQNLTDFRCLDCLEQDGNQELALIKRAGPAAQSRPLAPFIHKPTICDLSL
jgi:hypothetical protein